MGDGPEPIAPLSDDIFLIAKARDDNVHMALWRLATFKLVLDFRIFGTQAPRSVFLARLGGAVRSDRALIAQAIQRLDHQYFEHHH